MIRFEKKDTIRLSGIIRKIKSREKNTDLLIFEKILLLKNTEFFAPVSEMQLLDLVLGINETANGSQLKAETMNEPIPDAMVITSPSGNRVSIPGEKLYELMTGDPVMTERYLNLFIKTNNT